MSFPGDEFRQRQRDLEVSGVVLRVLHLAGGKARVPLGRVEQVAAGEEGVELQLSLIHI